MSDEVKINDSELNEVAGGAYNPKGNPQYAYPLNYSGSCWKYIIKSGDTLSAVAVKFGKNQALLQSINGIPDPNWIYAGQYMWIPY